MSEIKLPAASGGGSISIKGPASSGSDTDLLDTSGNLNITGQLTCGSHLNFGDGDEIKVGAGEDLLIYHTSDQNYLKSNNGRINLRASEVRCENAAGTEVLAKFIADGACELRHNDSAKLTTTANGIVVSGALEVNGGDVDFSDHLVLSTDSKAIKFGADSDLQIYHDGSHGYLKNTTGDFYFQNTSGENHIIMNPNAGVKLLYNDALVFQTAEYGAIIKRPSGGETTLELIGPEGQDSTIYMAADDGDDVADRWKMTAESDASNWKLFNAAAGYWVESIAAHGNAHVLLSHQGSGKVETTSSGCTVYGSVNETSDIALKKDVSPITNALANIKQLNGYSYTFKDTNIKSLGLTTQDVEKVYPDLVEGEEGTKTLQYSGIIAPLVEAIKELSAEVDTLKTKVAALEAALVN